MKADLKAKFLQHLNSKKQDKGFTLIELLVVIIIIGILSAIALPSFLSQSNKAKQSEAKTYVGSLNKGQQAYFTEQAKFATSDVSALGIGIKTATTNYTYTTAGTSQGTNSTAISKGTTTTNAAGLKPYAGMVQLIVSGTSSDVTSVSVLCEQKAPGTSGTAPADPTSATTGPACATDQVEVGQPAG